MATTNTDERNLAGTAGGPQFHEDLMDRINDISPEDLPFTDMIDTGGVSDAHYKEFVEEALEAADPDNMLIDGQDLTGNDSVLGVRKGAYHQISGKIVQVSDRARAVNAVGTSDELVKQVTKRNRALRRDVEARLTSNNATVAGNGTTTESECPGIGGWIGTSGNSNTQRGATGTDPTLSDTTGGYPNAAPGAGTKRAMTEAMLKTALRQVYNNNGNARYLMSRPEAIEIVSDYMYTSSARVAAMQTTVGQGNREGVAGGGGLGGGGIAAQGAVNVYVGNFGSVIFVPNRFQPESASGASDIFIIDPSLWEMSFLRRYYLKALGDTGLSSKRMIAVDYTLIALNEYGNAVIADIDTTLAMTA